MKTFSHNTPILIAVSFFICILVTKASFASSISDSSNLIQNSSFENNGQPTLQSWSMFQNTYQVFVQDVPPNGGQWSIGITPGWIPFIGAVGTLIVGQSGVGIYELTVWMKSNPERGSASFGRHAHDNPWKQVYCDSASWVSYSLVDTLSLQPNDTIVVLLSAGSDEVPLGNVLFDLVRLQKIQTMGSADGYRNSLPVSFALHQNYPNPFNPNTTISYELPASCFVTLRVFDLLGREIITLVNKQQQAGRYGVNFNANALTSGIYFYSIQSGQYRDTKKMLLIR